MQTFMWLGIDDDYDQLDLYHKKLGNVWMTEALVGPAFVSTYTRESAEHILKVRTEK